MIIRNYSAVDLVELTFASHVIDTGDASPVRVPPRPIPFHYTEKVQAQLKDMAKEGIIKPRNSPWCAPAVYVPQNPMEKSGYVLILYN